MGEIKPGNYKEINVIASVENLTDSEKNLKNSAWERAGPRAAHQIEVAKNYKKSFQESTTQMNMIKWLQVFLSHSVQDSSCRKGI